MKKILEISQKLKAWFKELMFFELLALLFIAIGVVAIIFLFTVSNYDHIFNPKERVNLENFGDLLGGFVGSLWSLAGVLLFYASLSSQKEELESQKNLLVQQINEVVNQTKEFKKQSTIAAIQKDETTFFQLLRFHNEIITSILLEISEVDFSDGSTKYRTIAGRKTFVEYYDIYKRFFNTQLENLIQGALTSELIQKVVNNSYSQFYDEYQADLGHYFRNLYNILNFINTLDEDQQKMYLSLLHAQLSNFELALLFFHCLLESNSDYKNLVEKYALLSTVPDDEIANMCKVLYTPQAFGKESFDEDENDNNNYSESYDYSTSYNNDNSNYNDNSFDMPNNDLLSRVSKLTSNSKNDGNSNSEFSFDDQLMSKLANLKRADNEDFDQGNDLNHNDDYSDNSFENSIMSKLSKLKSNDNDENSYDNYQEDSFFDRANYVNKIDDQDDSLNFENSIAAKLAKLKKQEDINQKDNQIDNNIDNSIMSKLAKLKKQDDSIDDFDDNSYDDFDNQDNSIMSKLAKLKKQEDSLDDFDDFSADDFDNQDNSIMSKLAKLKKQDDSIDDFDDNSADDFDNQDNSIMSKLAKLKKQEDSFDDFDNNSADDFDNQDNSIMSKLAKLKKQEYSLDDFDDKSADDFDSQDNSIMSKLAKLKKQDDSFDDLDDNSADDFDKQDNSIMSKLAKLKKQNDSFDEFDDNNADDFDNQDNSIMSKLAKLNKQEDSFDNLGVNTFDKSDENNEILSKLDQLSQINKVDLLDDKGMNFEYEDLNPKIDRFRQDLNKGSLNSNILNKKNKNVNNSSEKSKSNKIKIRKNTYYDFSTNAKINMEESKKMNSLRNMIKNNNI